MAERRTAIIVAGGKGVRMGGAVPKQFLMMGDRPVLAHTVAKFAGVVDKVIVVLPAGYADYWYLMAEKWGLDAELCEGGTVRFESVRNALFAAPDDTTLVCVHDGVRPLVSTRLIEESFSLAAIHGSAVPYTTPVDSFRLDGEPVDRSRLMAIQTPQTFRYDMLLDAYRRTPHADFTDDATVFAAAGHELHFFEGERRNIKITTPEDLIYANQISAR